MTNVSGLKALTKSVFLEADRCSAIMLESSIRDKAGPVNPQSGDWAARALSVEKYKHRQSLGKKLIGQ
jgi:hypothetical protein